MSGPPRFLVLKSWQAKNQGSHLRVVSCFYDEARNPVYSVGWDLFVRHYFESQLILARITRGRQWMTDHDTSMVLSWGHARDHPW